MVIAPISLIGVHFASFYITLPCFILIKIGFFNGEEGPNLEIFKELKVFLGAHIKEVQFWNEPRHIFQLLEAPAGHLQHNRMLEQSLAQRPRCCRWKAALSADPRHILGRWSSDWFYGYYGLRSSPEAYKRTLKASVKKEERISFCFRNTVRSSLVLS